WIYFEHNWLQSEGWHLPICEPDRERTELMHHGTRLLEQEARSSGRTRHQWLLVFIEHKHHRAFPFVAFASREAPLRGCVTVLARHLPERSPRHCCSGLLGPPHRPVPRKVF